MSVWLALPFVQPERRVEESVWYEMKIYIVFNFFIKGTVPRDGSGRGTEVYRKIRLSPILCEPFKYQSSSLFYNLQLGNQFI